jgi:hypothetical protein
MGAAVHNWGPAAELVAGRMCGVRNSGFGSVAGLAEGSAVVEAESTAAAQEA